MDLMALRETLDVETVFARFGRRVRSHRIGTTDLRLAEVERPDDMVRAVYPDAVTEHGDAPVWMITWPAALALAEWVSDPAVVAGRRVLELGCGTAAAGIAAERAGARVLVTDYDPLALRMAAHNAGLNGCRALETGRLDWYRPELRERFDLVLGSEIVYFEKSFGPLLSVLLRAAAPGAPILLSDQERPQMALFLDLCARAGFRHHAHRRVVHLPEQSRPIRIVELARTPAGPPLAEPRPRSVS